MVDKRRDAFIVNKKLKMKQAQSLIELKNEHNKRLNELVTTQNSDAEVPYMSLLTNEYTLEHIFNTEGKQTPFLSKYLSYVVRGGRTVQVLKI